MTGNWLLADDGNWFNADFAERAKKCPVSAAGGTPRWQFLNSQGESLGVITALGLSSLLVEGGYRRPMGQPKPPRAA
jgi:hypothetical protein